MNEEKAIKILGLSGTFNDVELKKAYRNKSNIYHPDLHTNESDESQKKYVELMQEVNSAYEFLKNKRKNRTILENEQPKNEKKWNPPSPPTNTKNDNYYANVQSMELLYLNLNMSSSKLDKDIEKIKKYIGSSGKNNKVNVILKKYIDLLELTKMDNIALKDKIDIVINNKNIEYSEYIKYKTAVAEYKNNLINRINLLNDGFFTIVIPKFNIDDKNFVQQLIYYIAKELTMRDFVKSKIIKKYTLITQEKYNQMYKFIAQRIKERQIEKGYSIEMLDKKVISSIIKEEKLNFKKQK